MNFFKGMQKFAAFRFFSLFFLGSLLFVSPSCEDFDFNDLPLGLTEEEVVSALKEALKVGTDSSVVTANVLNGYFGNEIIKILLPDELNQVQSFINNELGFLPGIQDEAQNLIDNLVLKLNRAAENAAVKAKPIFFDAITGITIDDGFAILEGTEDAATNYLQTNTNENLYTSFKPDIQNALEDVQAQQIWQQLFTLIENYDFLNLVSDDINPDLADYTTNKALGGLFHLVAKEEKNIRENVEARVTDLLEKVFGTLDD